MKVAVVVLLSIVGATLTEPAYHFRGWRPPGQSFNPAKYQQQRFPAQTYGRPPASVEPLPAATTTTTTTPRSRESTTPGTPSVQISPEGSSAEDFETTGTPLAVANSFAFNRPIYVYNAGFPFHPAYYSVLQ